MSDKDQGKLLEIENPLQERVGKKFFDELPKGPGVYKMYSRGGQLLYVGKAKNLRIRLFTYRRTGCRGMSSKVRKLICMVHKIEYECCGTEEEALLRENKLIREHQPGFNVAKKKPHTYYYVNVKPQDYGLSFGLSMRLDESNDHGFVFGAFKGHHNVRMGMGALLRQLYLQEYKLSSVFHFPGILLRKLTPDRYDLKVKCGGFVDDKIMNELFCFLEGSSLELMSSLVQSVSDRNLLQDFMGRMILKDFESLKRFYDHCARRNYNLKETLSLPSHLIPQHKLDDYLVKAAFVR